MATAFNTFDQYAPRAYEGLIHDLSMADVTTRLAGGGDIGYGLGVTHSNEYTAKVPTAFSEKPDGITSRETVKDNPAGDSPTPVYEQDTEMSVVRSGRVWVRPTVAVAIKDPVHVVPNSGEITNTDASSTNPQLPNAEFRTATSAADELALVQLNGTP